MLLDMYAGVEHLGRATVDFVDAMLIVVEPTRRSLGTAAQIKKLANDIGLTRLYLVGNKVRNDEEVTFLEAETPGIPVLGYLPADLKVQEADRLNLPVYDHAEDLKVAAARNCRKAGESLMTTTIALAGKGGVGKTTIAAMIIKYLAQNQTGSILAIDADPSSNLEYGAWPGSRMDGWRHSGRYARAS